MKALGYLSVVRYRFLDCEVTGAELVGSSAVLIYHVSFADHDFVA
jgi:hypothetical protein